MSESTAEISERAQLMLRALIERYVVDGQPVGSRTLAREAGLRLSPATIRNVMADLEDLGFVSSPHTSAGRVPTVQGYRFFVDTLLSVKPLDQRAIEQIRAELEVEQSSKDLVESASGMLSGITQLARKTGFSPSWSRATTRCRTGFCTPNGQFPPPNCSRPRIT